ncbi:MAG: hypothetical protein ACE5I1_06740 [bacterium]
MPYQMSNKNFIYWIELLKNMADGHEKSGAPLRDDLKKELDEAVKIFEPLVTQYKSLRAAEKQARQDASKKQEEGRDILYNTRYALLSQVPAEQINAVLQGYHLHGGLPKRRNAVLANLRFTKEAIAKQTNDLLKPPKEIIPKLNEAYNALEEKIKEIQAVRADVEEVRRKLRNAMLSNAELRERILAYLIFVLPEGRQDPKLMDYGLRAHFGGRRSRVEVVSEEEVSTQETEVEEIETSE